jgi:predicted DNA-binding protein
MSTKPDNSAKQRALRTPHAPHTSKTPHTTTKSVSCRLSTQVEADLRELAKRDHRTFASYMEHVLSVHVQEQSSHDVQATNAPRARLVNMVPDKSK